jgi:hypothetical protein
MGRKRGAVEVLRQRMLLAAKNGRWSVSEMARAVSAHGSNYHTVLAFLRGVYDPAPEAFSQIATAFQLFGAELDRESVLAAILGSTLPHTCLLEAILGRPEAEQEWILGKLLARSAALKIAQAKP